MARGQGPINCDFALRREAGRAGTGRLAGDGVWFGYSGSRAAPAKTASLRGESGIGLEMGPLGLALLFWAAVSAAHAVVYFREQFMDGGDRGGSPVEIGERMGRAWGSPVRKGECVQEVGLIGGDEPVWGRGSGKVPLDAPQLTVVCKS